MKSGKILTKENIKNIEETLANLSKASEKLDKTLVSLDTILKGIERGEGSLGLLMTDKALAEDLKTLVEDLKSHPRLLWRR